MSLLVVGHAHSMLVRSIAAKLDAQIVFFQINAFSDTETIVVMQQYNQVNNKTIIIVFECEHTSVRLINDQILRILQVIHALNQWKPKSISVIFSYLPYARQNIGFDEHLQGALYMLITCLNALGVTHIYGIEIHIAKTITTFPVLLSNISIESHWISIINEHIIKNSNRDLWCIVSPDEGGKKYAERIAQLCNVSSGYIIKTRLGIDQSKVLASVGNFFNKNIIIIDDIIDTANTAFNACTLLKKHTVKKIYGCFTHAVCFDSVFKHNEFKSFEHVFITNTIQGVEKMQSKKVTIVSIHEYIAYKIKELYGT